MLSISHLTKTYKGNKAAVDDLSLTIENGDIYGFIGHNGAGKTTTIKCIMGILDYERGEITLDGHSIKKEPIYCKSQIAYIPDNPDIYEHLTGIQYLNFICDIYQVSKEQRDRDIKKFADAFEMTSHLGDLISSYSHGMKQKLALISAFAHEPKLLILDEPFVGLDPKASLLLKETMRELCTKGCSIFFSTHVLEVAEKLCNKIAIIKDGALITAGSTAELTHGKSLEEVFMEVVQ
ncbi:MAG: ABC transporter ATP-binding protein [Lachnospiraceae bacterium]|nr:ABC transporter ATP-binding protein [Lachnospiraceae bacterium]MDD3616437.1 ABC transporter ATP-binding protein [Lachnospiraceae bacterium]